MWMIPRSCRTPSAAIVAGRTRARAAVRSPWMRPGSSTWTAATIAACSAAVSTPNGTVGVVEEVRIRSRPASAQEVGRVAAAGALDVEGVDGATGERGQRPLDREHLVEAVGVDRELDVVAVTDVQRGADLRRPRADVLVDLQRGAAGAQAVLDALGRARRSRARRAPR